MTDIYGFGLPTLPADWLAARGTEAGPLFTNFDRAGKGRRLTGVSLYRIVRGLGEQHGVKVRPHGLRHTAITEACKAAQANGFGLEEVLDFSRHSRKSIAVLMIYRDEYYNPETPDRGITEVIVTKHRNGPVGTCKLLFEPQFTRFRNLAAPGGL